MKKNEILSKFKEQPKQYFMAFNDALNAIKGKWKLPIILSLFSQKNRFNDLQENIEKITPKMLSKELKDLELNGILKKTTNKEKPTKIEYELTESGKNIVIVLEAMANWGIDHRESIINSQNNFCI